jgi:hypothetical protein
LLKGTHSGAIDYTGILRGVPVVQPTARRVRVPSEYFEYFVENGLIVRTVANLSGRYRVAIDALPAAWESAQSPQ